MKQSMKMMALALGLAVTVSGQASSVDVKLPAYKKVSGVSGTLNSVGSDTLNNMMALWAESFQALYPNVKIQIEGKGSSTAPPALIEGSSQIGPMSRPMKATEIDAFEKKFGYKPSAVGVAIDALAVFVHKDNPAKGLTLKQIDSAFSSTFKLGGKPAKNWGDLGLSGAWSNRAISLYGRNSASGTYGVFKDIALSKGDYASNVKEQPGSSAVVQGIGSDLGGLGYSGYGYKTSSVRALPVNGYPPSADNALSGKYPLGRVLYVYYNHKPGTKLDATTREFLKFTLSQLGQEVVVKDGYFPLNAGAANRFRSKLK
ncbi:MAG: PstS family phosphate ABC transporter substrate-binding protein [Limisphaerales bacterium]